MTAIERIIAFVIITFICFSLVFTAALNSKIEALTADVARYATQDSARVHMLLRTHDYDPEVRRFLDGEKR